MREILEIWRHHGYSILFLWVLGDQLGVAPPSIPVLIVAGAFAAMGQASVSLVLLLAIVASLISDYAWYFLGRLRGKGIVRLLCRISLQPDSCVNKTENTFARWGLRSLLIAKFVPGISTVSPPLAGAFRASALQFLAYDGMGALLWSSSSVLLGYLFSNQLESVAAYLAHLSHLLCWLLIVLLLSAYPAIKFMRRRRLFACSRAARISAEDLKRKLDSGVRITILDVRHPLDVLSSPYIIPTAIRIPVRELKTRVDDLPQDAEIVAYCTCPGDSSAVKAYQTLQAAGLTSANVLNGGLDAWRENGFPVEPLEIGSDASAKAAWAF